MTDYVWVPTEGATETEPDPFDYYGVDDEIPYPAWMEEDLYDRYEADYNDMLAAGGDL